MIKRKSATKKAIDWIAKDHENRTDAEAARKFELANSSPLGAYRKKHKIGRDGKAVAQ